ncbi:hypothetical protein [Flavobacterium agrisoli]|uniref:Uncharacterized protein n=1 Tax=Flavobacterium agrisoli TaxID=2793066 RepID=A0A934PN99_9FLAO|nr:hypothetical protein [Flavobacterium agrisoli]MBK0369934.1 hypothetical protein [Flavobacterium agrisoli]
MSKQDFLDKLNAYYEAIQEGKKSNWSSLFPIPTSVISFFETELQLTFIEKYEPGNVCFRNDTELRPEFKTVFTATDLIAFFLAQRDDNKQKLDWNHFENTFSETLFWPNVDLGKRFLNPIL